jgi:PadR family transcriptional regulator, regulatory protein PadR
MPRSQSPLQTEMVQGTLDMLILQTLLLGPAHGQTIAHAIERGSEAVLQVEHGSLYPALHRLQNRAMASRSASGRRTQRCTWG